MVLLFLHVTVFLGFTDSLFSSLVVVVVVVEAGTGTEGGNWCVYLTKGGGGEDDITAAKGGRGLADCLISQVWGSVVSGTRTLGP